MPPTPSTQNPAPGLHIFGIRHHGPGSARSLRVALEALCPDIILVEGPPDAENVLPLLAHPQMQPPVALLIYAPDSPQRSVYYPFARFSPEWQAIDYGLQHAIPVRFMDLPQAYQLVPPSVDLPEAGESPEASAPPEAPPASAESSPEGEELPVPRRDPLGFLAAAAGYSDGERWWEHMVEQRRDSAGLFEAILEVMATVRSVYPTPEGSPEALLEQRREAWMRQTIRAAQREGFSRIAVVCGAWHAPALADLSGSKTDSATVKGLPKAKVQATWVPWTYARLSFSSGYGAGVLSPGWYHHLFESAAAGHSAGEIVIGWATQIARLLREEGIASSSAHAIETVRLAETLAALRDRPLPGLPELNEAARAVFCFDTDLPMQLIHERLIVSERLGTVPDETPMVPLQQDLLREQRRLRLPAEATWRDLDLDLRKSTDLDRSRLLHRLVLLGVGWGELTRSGGGKGTFREHWRIQWQPELAVQLIEAGIWGNTLLDAATNRVCAEAERAADLPALTQLVNQALLADLPRAMPRITAQLEAQAAQTSDVPQMMAALPSLANVLRYGDVRQTDAGMVAHVVDGLVTRICIGLPGACASLNDDAAAAMLARVSDVHGVVTLLQNEQHTAAWCAALHQLANLRGLHGLLAGRCVRLLLDLRVFDSAEAARRVNLALSPANDPAYAAGWIEGLLRDSGALLLHDDALWQVIDGWVCGLAPSTLQQVLPLLRRTFATFQPAERRNLGQRVRQGSRSVTSSETPTLDSERATAVLPLLRQILGVVKADG